MHLHSDDDELLAQLADYLTAAWAEGGTAIVLATGQHLTQLRALLTGRRQGPLPPPGRFIQLDAAATLRLFMVNGVPDTFLFQETVAALVRQHAAFPPLRVFGELVDVLWQQGNVVAALRLEQMWDRLQQDVPFTLLCSYSAEHVDADGRDELRRLHDHVLS